MKIMRLVVIGLLVAACGAEPGQTPITTTTMGDSVTTVPESTERAAQAIADLAQRLNIDPTLITLSSDEDMTWSDGSIGCPDPGMSYTQAMVEGYLIVLSVDDTDYRYHGAHQSDPFLCEQAALDRMPGGG